MKFSLHFKKFFKQFFLSSANSCTVLWALDFMVDKFYVLMKHKIAVKLFVNF